MSKFKDELCKTYETTGNLKKACQEARNEQIVAQELEDADKNISRIMKELQMREFVRKGMEK